MAYPVLSAAHTVCQLRDWTVSNLELQKILYIAHMFHLGTTDGQPLILEPFEAWEYGPVVPALYRRARAFGSEPVRNVFHWDAAIRDGTTEYKMLKEASEATKTMKAGRLVSVTHWPDGAWAKCYRSGERGIIIPNHLILEEFRARRAA